MSRSQKRSALACLTAALGLTLFATPAFAHTFLESSRPAGGEVLDEPLQVVELAFTRSIELLPETIWLLDASGATVTREVEVQRSADGTVVTGTLDEPLFSGSWEIHWRILASDSHPREGVIAVAVADGVVPPAVTPVAPVTPVEPTPSPSAAPSSTPTVDGQGDAVAEEDVGQPVLRTEATPSSWAFEVMGDVLRSLFYLGLMVAVGLALFKAGPHRGEASNAVGLARAVALSAGVALVAGLLEVVAHAGALSGRGWSGTLDGGTWAAIMRTGLGTALVVRSAGLVLLLAGGLRRARRDVPSGPDPTKLLGAGLVIVSFQFVGHTASTAPAWAIRSADLVHVVAAAVWVGGLVGLAMLSGHTDRLGRARTAARFSSGAIVAVAAVAAAGMVMASLNIPERSMVISTGYGRLLLAKLAVVAVLGVLGAHNHFRVVPRLSDGDTDALDDLRRTVSAEVVLVVVVLVLTALLINTTPL